MKTRFDCDPSVDKNYPHRLFLMWVSDAVRRDKVSAVLRYKVAAYYIERDMHGYSVHFETTDKKATGILRSHIVALIDKLRTGFREQLNADLHSVELHVI